MSDVKVELKELVSRDDAAAWLSMLAKALGSDGDVELPLGSSVMTVHVPDLVRAEVEVEVDRDEVEVEIEFKWSTAERQPASSDAQRTGSAKVQGANSARKQRRTAKRLGVR